jgi:hypothetical protein
MPRKNPNAPARQPAVVGWRPEEWRNSFSPPLSKSQIAAWISDGTVPSAKPGGARFITISPTDFLERHRQQPAASA